MPTKLSEVPAHLPASPFRAVQGGVVFAHDQSAGPQPRDAAAERILVVEDDFLVATQIEAALIDAGFAIAGVAFLFVTNF